ncbi:MAG: hypothetical protein AUK47_19670 [Deltaproteobacteria bacterium CG2_30_63_29]|nr:MAG: hypothetical protein AUK47_19670 [Deltaproteobacteria bacterium CG2_30_63_29]PJB33769.1 MAG: hypothetical protein CO108_30170 [Deltaproteobacteria bacterium CG_4_9_14_3_um_filter_63_12]
MRRFPFIALLILLLGGCLPQRAEHEKEEGEGASQKEGEEAIPVCEADEAPQVAKDLVPEPKTRPPKAKLEQLRRVAGVDPKVAKPVVEESKPAGPAPAIGCDAPSFDYGTVAQGDDVKHTFVVKNSGLGPLTISRADGG